MMGSVTLTSPRRAMSASNIAVKTFVTEPISKTVSGPTSRESPIASRPCRITRRPCRVTIPTTMPTLCFVVSMRSSSIRRIAASSGGCACAAEDHRFGRFGSGPHHPLVPGGSDPKGEQCTNEGPDRGDDPQHPPLSKPQDFRCPLGKEDRGCCNEQRIEPVYIRSPLESRGTWAEHQHGISERQQPPRADDQRGDQPKGR